jgi:hypothetical protein
VHWTFPRDFSVFLVAGLVFFCAWALSHPRSPGLFGVDRWTWLAVFAVLVTAAGIAAIYAFTPYMAWPVD